MSRRGGVRLHPVKDGKINPSRHTESIRRTDIAGNKLVDVVDPESGFCVGVRSNIESAPVNPAGCSTMRSGISGTPSGTLALLATEIRVDSESGDRVYLDADGRRIRTTAMGERHGIAVPRSAGTDIPAQTQKEGRRVSARAPKSTTRPVPGGTGDAGRITDADVESYIRALARIKLGRELDIITPTMMRDGREALKLARKQAALALAKRDRKR